MGKSSPGHDVEAADDPLALVTLQLPMPTAGPASMHCSTTLRSASTPVSRLFMLLGFTSALPAPALADLLGIAETTATRWAALAARDGQATSVNVSYEARPEYRTSSNKARLGSGGERKLPQGIEVLIHRQGAGVNMTS